MAYLHDTRSQPADQRCPRLARKSLTSIWPFPMELGPICQAPHLAQKGLERTGLQCIVVEQDLHAGIHLLHCLCMCCPSVRVLWCTVLVAYVPHSTPETTLRHMLHLTHSSSNAFIQRWSPRVAMAIVVYPDQRPELSRVAQIKVPSSVRGECKDEIEVMGRLLVE